MSSGTQELDGVNQSTANRSSMFTLTPNQEKMVEKWSIHHECKVRNRWLEGKYTYCFTPMAMGVVEIVKCACGSELNITDYASW